MNVQLTDDQRHKILARSGEAQAFIRSDLFVELERWVKEEQEAATVGIILDRRTEQFKNLTREQYVERMCAYYEAVATVTTFFKQLARQADALKQIEETDGSNQGTSQE